MAEGDITQQPGEAAVEEIPLGFGTGAFSYEEMARSWFHNHMRLISAGMDEQARRLFNNAVGLFYPIWNVAEDGTTFTDRLIGIDVAIRSDISIVGTDEVDAVFQLQVSEFMAMLSAAGVMKKPDIILDIHPNHEVPKDADDVCGND